MSVTFRRRIQWPENELLLPAEYFDVQVPTGLSSFDVRAPNFVDVLQMGRLGQSNSAVGPSGQLAIVNGRVTRELEVNFADPAGQWRRLPSASGQPSRNGPGQFRFSGGEVFLDLTLGVYILNTVEPDARDELSVQIFAEIYGHELLHVLDEIDIVSRWLPAQLNSDPTISTYLVQAQAFTYGTPSQRIEDTELEFRTYIRNTIQSTVRAVWAPETNQRAGRRDAPAQYKIVQDRVDTLRARQINRPRP